MSDEEFENGLRKVDLFISNEELENSLRKIATWAALKICDRDKMICPEQAVWALYPHMQLLKAAETILGWMNPNLPTTILVDLPGLDQSLAETV